MNTKLHRLSLLLLTLLVCLSASGKKFKEKDLTLVNGDFSMPGTLLMAGNKKAPVVIFVHGSGPNDRDETVGPNKPFRQLAEGLASFGISSFRYDKRTMIYKGSADTITYMGETVEDAVAAVKMLSGMGYRHIFVAGHSLGGHCLPLIAKATEGIAEGYIILSGNVRTMRVMIDGQLSYIGKIQNLPQQTIDTYKEQMMASLPKRYIEFDETYKPDEVIKTLAPARWLVIQGGHDYQVTKEDFDLWNEYFGDKAEYFFGDTLDHLLRHSESMATPASYLSAGEVDQSVINSIAGFILSHK